MRNINILLKGRVKQIDVYENMFEYVKDSDIIPCEIDYADGQPDYFVKEWQPARDMYYEYDLMRDAGEIEIDGQKYTRINRGETEVSYVPEYSLPETLYIVYHCDQNLKKCTCVNELFQTKEEAERRASELKGE